MTLQTPKQTLLEFLLELQSWIDKGTPADHPIFVSKVGLCYNLVNYITSTPNANLRAYLALTTILRNQYRDNYNTPFNITRSANSYTREKNKYTNRLRLAFIAKLINDISNPPSN